jgi:hypothetical protein
MYMIRIKTPNPGGLLDEDRFVDEGSVVVWTGLKPEYCSSKMMGLAMMVFSHSDLYDVNRHFPSSRTRIYFHKF